MSKEDEDFQLALALSLSEAKQQTSSSSSSSSSSSMTEQEKAFFSNSPLEYKNGESRGRNMPITSSSSSNGRVYGHRGAFHAMGSPPPPSSSSSSPLSSGVSSSSFRKAEAKGNINNTAKRQEDIDRDFALALKFQEDEKEAVYRQQQQQQQQQQQRSAIPHQRHGSGSMFSQSRQTPNQQRRQQQREQQSGFMGLGFMDSSKCGGGSAYGGCGWPLLAGQIQTFNGIRFHAGCFKCAHCQQPISGQFQLHAPPSASGDGSDTLNAPTLPYHVECAEHLFVPTCSLCPEKLKGEYYRHPFFLESCYCKVHEGRKACFSCSRKEPLPSSGKEGFSHLPDGRALCMDCARTAIIDSSEAQPLYLDCIDFMEKELGLCIPPGMRQVPVLAVDIPSLNEQSRNTRAQYHATAKPSNPSGIGITRGLTLKECGTVNHYSGGSVRWDPLNFCFVSTPPQIYHTEEIRAASAVLVLMGLPTDLTASILAHEAFHVWCSLTKGFPFVLPPEVEEGMCQLMAYKYLEYIRENKDKHAFRRSESQKNRTSITSSPNGQIINKTLSPDEWDARLRAFLSNQIETDTNPVYGGGFRQAAECYAALGLDVLLQHIKDYKQFPRVS